MQKLGGPSSKLVNSASAYASVPNLPKSSVILKECWKLNQLNTMKNHSAKLGYDKIGKSINYTEGSPGSQAFDIKHGSDNFIQDAIPVRALPPIKVHSSFLGRAVHSSFSVRRNNRRLMPVMHMDPGDGDDLIAETIVATATGAASGAADSAATGGSVGGFLAAPRVTLFSAFSALAAGYSVVWGYIETRKFMKNWLKR